MNVILLRLIQDLGSVAHHIEESERWLDQPDGRPSSAAELGDALDALSDLQANSKKLGMMIANLMEARS